MGSGVNTFVSTVVSIFYVYKIDIFYYIKDIYPCLGGLKTRPTFVLSVFLIFMFADFYFIYLFFMIF